MELLPRVRAVAHEGVMKLAKTGAFALSDLYSGFGGNMKPQDCTPGVQAVQRQTQYSG